RHEAAGQRQIDRGEVEQRAVLRRQRQSGDQRVALVVVQRPRSLFPGPGLDGAGDLDFVAEAARQVDVEADQLALVVAIVEGREVRRGQEADSRYAGEIGRQVARARIDVIGQR